MNLKSLQINLNRAELAQTELLANLDRDGDAFVFIQEPYTYKNKMVRLPKGYNCFPTRLCGRPRVAIYTKKSSKFAELNALSSRDCVAAFGKINGMPTVIASVYMDINDNNVISPEVSKLIEFVDAGNYALIIAADTNAHSLLYSDRENKRGETLDEFILANHLQIENIGRKPTFQSANGNSIIDVTLTKNLNRAVQHWRVDQDYNGSDHNTIRFALRREKIVVEPYRPWDRSDWAGFTDQLRRADIYLSLIHI